MPRKTLRLRAPFVWFVGLFVWFAGVRPLAADNVTFCYHQFDYSLQNIYSVLPEVFAWQVAYIRNAGYPIIPLDTLVSQYRSGAKVIPNSVLLTIDDGWKNTWAIVPTVQRDNVPITLFVYPEVFNHDQYFETDDLLRLRTIPGIDFGCHSYTHPVMRRMGPDALRREVLQSKLELERLLGRPVETFAYPFGIFDRNTKAWVSRSYQASFGVNDGANGPRTDPYNLNRFVIYRTTSFGEFIDDLDHAAGRHRERGYSIRFLGMGREARYFFYTRVKLYQFPAEPRPQSLLIVPSSEVGAAWIYKLIASCKDSDLNVSVMVNRNNNLPFYRPGKEMRVISNWGLEDSLEDLELAVDAVLKDHARTTIFTWGDGFDLLMALLAKRPELQTRVQGLLVLNPSILVPGETAGGFAQKVKEYDGLLNRGEYASENLKYFLKVKTLADMMIIDPQGRSPFGPLLGFQQDKSNLNAFLDLIDQTDHPDFDFDPEHQLYSQADFKAAFMQPMPVFSMVVPLKLERDLNWVWQNGFKASKFGIRHPERIQISTEFFYCDGYLQNRARIERTFPGLRTPGKWVDCGELSTIEAMLASDWVKRWKDNIVGYCQIK